MEFLTNEQKKTVTSSAKLILIGILIGAVLAGGIALKIGWSRRQQEEEEVQPTPTPEVVIVSSNEEKKLEVTVEYVEKKLENLGELSTAQMIYSGLCTVESGKVPLISKKGFSMVYQGEVKAGIDVSEIRIDITEEQVCVVLPAAVVFDSHVDPTSVQFFDEKRALFNRDEKTDVTEALTLAELDMEEKANTDGLLERANSQAELLVRSLLEDVVGERTVSVTHSEA